MDRLGTILHIVQNKLIVRGESKKSAKLPKINSVVVNRKLVKIGRVFDVFGPVDNPYIVVSPYRKVDASVHVGKKLYTEESRFSGRNRKD
ncbi:MAG: H/ACA ribonucleoprotein complex subunit GAR1 [Methanotrichaceae archaeon]